MVESTNWVGTMGFGSTWPLGPETKAYWVILEHIMGSPATSPPLYPRWLSVGRHKGPDPPKAG